MKKFYWIIFMFLIGCISSECLKGRQGTIVLNYNDFGPQCLAYETLGMQWYQWNKVGDCEGKEDYIRVVVYKNLSLDEVKKLYPVDKEKEMDYRYIEYNKAIDYLEKTIKDTEENANDFETLRDLLNKLRNTKTKIVTTLGK